MLERVSFDFEKNQARKEEYFIFVEKILVYKNNEWHNKDNMPQVVNESPLSNSLDDKKTTCKPMNINQLAVYFNSPELRDIVFQCGLMCPLLSLGDYCENLDHFRAFITCSSPHLPTIIDQSFETYEEAGQTFKIDADQKKLLMALNHTNLTDDIFRKA